MVKNRQLKDLVRVQNKHGGMSTTAQKSKLQKSHTIICPIQKTYVQKTTCDVFVFTYCTWPKRRNINNRQILQPLIHEYTTPLYF